MFGLNFAFGMFSKCGKTRKHEFAVVNEGTNSGQLCAANDVLQAIRIVGIGKESVVRPRRYPYFHALTPIMRSQYF